MTTATNTSIRFQNHAVVVDGERFKVSYSHASANEVHGERISVYGDSFGSFFPAALRRVFAVKNDTDSQTDYFERDRFVVTPQHPRWADVLAAYNSERTSAAKRAIKAAAKKGDAAPDWATRIVAPPVENNAHMDMLTALGIA